MVMQREKKLDRRIEPEDGNARSAKKFGAARLSVGAAAKGEHGGFPVFGGAAQGSAKLIGFDLPKGGLAKAFEELRDRESGGLLDAFIEVDEMPRELAREKRADGRLARAHKTSEAKYLGAGRRATQRRGLSHSSIVRAATKGPLHRDARN